MKLLIPDTIDLELSAPEGVTVSRYAVAEPIPAQDSDAEAVVVWANPQERLRALTDELPQLRWVQGLMAGMDAVRQVGFGQDVVLTSGVGLHDGPVAEHTLALILAAARRLDIAVRAQGQRDWDEVNLGGNQALRTEGFSTLAGTRSLIWGFGSIGQHLAPWLDALGSTVTGVASSAGTRSGYPVITPDDLGSELPRTDLLINILPASAATEKVVDQAVFAALPAHAWFFNVGRGATVDEDALVEALRTGQIAGAGIDVTTTEPLPDDSPLWSAPNLILTPHSAGGRPRGAATVIEANLQRFLDGEPLAGVVDR